METIEPTAGMCPDTVTLTFPVRDRSPTAISVRHIELQLDLTQARALTHLFAGMDERRLRLRNGRYVLSGPDVVRYLLEQVAAEVRKGG